MTDDLLRLVLENPGAAEALMKNYDLEQTAKILGCYPSYLTENLKALSHQKIGQAVAFDVIDMLAIKAKCRRTPTALLGAVEESETAPVLTEAPAYAAITPAQGRRTRKAG